MSQTAAALIQPVLKDEELLRDIENANVQNGHFRLWWLGQSGFLVQWNRHHLLLDPYLSDTAADRSTAPAGSDGRPAYRVLDPKLLNFVEVAALTNVLPDHTDPRTLGSLLDVDPNVRIVVPAAYREVVAGRLGLPPKRLFSIDDGLSVEVAAFQITAVPAAHGELEYDSLGRCKYLGYVVRFGRWTLYHSGDTIRYGGMAEGLRGFHIDVALLPIDGRPPGRGVPGNLDGRQAALLAHDMHAKFVIPCHYGLSAAGSGSPDQFATEAERLGVRYQVLRCAQRWDSTDHAW
jgi:L-ascorbate metabolism protein UlaG (beta-lactamase superfamily)